MGFVLNDWFLCCIQVFPFMHVSVAFATSWILRVICPYSISFCLHYIRRPLSSHKEVYLTQHPSWMKTNMLHNVLALVSLFVVWYMHCSVAYGYNFKYLIYLFHVNKLVSQLQLLSNLMLFPSHIENAAWVMVATLTPFTCRKPRVVGSVGMCRYQTRDYTIYTSSLCRLHCPFSHNIWSPYEYL